MTESQVVKVFNRMQSFLDLGLNVFVYTEDESYEITYNTTCFRKKIWDEEWEINISDVERFEIIQNFIFCN